jgi:hypothetical protein
VRVPEVLASFVLIVCSTPQLERLGGGSATPGKRDYVVKLHLMAGTAAFAAFADIGTRSCIALEDLAPHFDRGVARGCWLTRGA